MKRTDFAYDLPAELIAQEPRQRGHSRMMVVTPDRGGAHLSHREFDAFPSLLEPGSVLVLNDTRVIPARLFAAPNRSMTRRIEVLLTRRLDDATWECWCRPAKRVRVGDALTFSDRLRASVMERREDGVAILRFESDVEVTEEIERVGVTPLPPYIRREHPRPADRDAYQTVYARARGAIAAPTAGLHFTADILKAIEARGVEIVHVTLHVGAGTFRPVKVDDIAEHRMDSERYIVTADAAARLNAALDERRPIVAVGTTSVRTLESAIRRGQGRFREEEAETSLFITPGFEFQAVHRLLTNFHLPESTLLMLVSAFAGVETIREAYAAAVRERYFFYSYGDCMFLARRERSGPGD